jgi:DNA polymerase
MEKIICCKKCNLYKNQKPLLDHLQNGDVMWVGLSAKKVDSLDDCIPLGNNTNSGKLIEKIENENVGIAFYKTNLVKCLPLDNKLKLRYPIKEEKESCYGNLEIEIKSIKPKIIFLLGLKAANFVLSKYGEKIKQFSNDFNYRIYEFNNCKYIPIHHPSYVHVYKKKKISDYINSVSSIIRNNLK